MQLTELSMITYMYCSSVLREVRMFFLLQSSLYSTHSITEKQELEKSIELKNDSSYGLRISQ